MLPMEVDEMEANGEMAVTDIVRLQKENKDLEQQVTEKNKVRALVSPRGHLSLFSTFQHQLETSTILSVLPGVQEVSRVRRRQQKRDVKELVALARGTTNAQAPAFSVLKYGKGVGRKVSAAPEMYTNVLFLDRHFLDFCFL